MVAAMSSKAHPASFKAPPTPLVGAYVIFFVAALGLYRMVMDNEGCLSSVFTLAEMLQCLAMMLLAGQVVSTQNVHGISARCVGLEALALCCRLSSTLWLNGYLPVDESGDWFYQAVDLCALAGAIWLLYQITVVHRGSFDVENDTFPILPLVVAAFVLAALFHANMNLRPVFDSLWMAGLFLSSVAVLPQLWLIMRTGGRVETLMSHYIAVMAISRALSGWFMYIARDDVSYKPYVEGVNHSIIAIFSAHLLHLLLLADFAYYYLKAVATQGLKCVLEFETTSNYV